MCKKVTVLLALLVLATTGCWMASFLWPVKWSHKRSHTVLFIRSGILEVLYDQHGRYTGPCVPPRAHVRGYTGFGVEYLAFDPVTKDDNFKFRRWRVSLWPIILLLVVSQLLLMRRTVFLPHRRRMRGMCTRCGYDLTGNTSGVCPECGTTIEARGAKQENVSPICHRPVKE